MGYRAAEEIILPARFLSMTAHFVAVLTILFDVKTLASQVVLAQHSSSASYSEADTDHTTKQLNSLAWVAVACFIVEYIGLFIGVSLFMRAHNCLYILLHFIGAITVGLMYTQAWSIGALVAIVVVFSCLPAALELLTFVFVARISFFSY